MRYVLDANVAIAALNGVVAVSQRLASVPGSEVGIPIVAIAELTFGAYKSRQRKANLEGIADLRRSVTVLGSDFDLLIACTALSESATLGTNDPGLLDGQIHGLQVENWLGGDTRT